MAWYPHSVTEAATEEPVTLDEVKEQVKPAGSFDDGLLNRLIRAARAHVEKYCGTPLASRTVAVKCDSFADFAVFPVVPLFEISSISYVDSAGDAQTLGSDWYEGRADGLEASIALNSGYGWPTIRPGSRITVSAVVGYDEMPDDVVHALLLLVGHWYENRENGSNPPDSTLDSLLSNHRASFS